MAAAMAYPITMSTTKEDMAFKKLQAHMRDARNADGQDDPAQTLGDFPLLNARFGGSRRY